MIEPLFRLINNLSSGNRDYVVFIGAGFSKDAGIKSGWDILIETLIPLYSKEMNIKELPEDYYSIIEKWYLEHNQYNKLEYSEILELMYEGEIERREYLKKFFKDAQPGESHRQLALMVANKLIRFIFTTNFDDLIEKALDEMNIDYDVIFSDDVLNQTKSWDKVDSCRIYKLHGDYKTGKVRNTINELEKLDPLISDDFQYIIDRHGSIVIGYAGRDKGVMKHFLKRKPYPYPFYWQYVKHPEDKSKFKLYYEFKYKYKNEFNREIHFIQNNSASSFLSEINNGIEKLNKIVITSKEKPNFKDYIINNDEKKIRALTLDLVDKFKKLYIEYRDKEDLDRHYDYRFEIFEKFINEIKFIFLYLNELLTYNLEGESKYFFSKIINCSVDNWDAHSEFIKRSTPYYIIMNSGALFLKNDYFSLVSDFYDLKIKFSSGHYDNLISYISYEEGGWEYIGKQKYKQNYYIPQYSIIQKKLLPSIISPQNFNYIDAYITIDLVIRDLNYSWVPGSSMSRNAVQDVYDKYFESKINNKSEALRFTTNLNNKYGNLNWDIRNGIYGLYGTIIQKFQIKENK